MTRTSNGFTASMSNEDMLETMRGVLTSMLNKCMKQNELMDYRHAFLAVDIMEAKTWDDMIAVSWEMHYGLYEKRASVLWERMLNGLDMIRTETDANKAADMWKHYKKLEREREEVLDRCLITRYVWNPYPSADASF